MRKLICELCGSSNLLKTGGAYVCQSCGAKYSVEAAKELIKDVPDDETDEREADSKDVELDNLYEVARRARKNKDYPNAQRYYEQIVIKDPSSWEANFYTVYYQALNCKIGEIAVEASRIENNVQTTLDLIKNDSSDPLTVQKELLEVASDLIIASNMLFNAYRNYYLRIDYQIQYRYRNDYATACVNCMKILYDSGNRIIRTFGDSYGYISAVLWKVAVRQHKIIIRVLKHKRNEKKFIEDYEEKILRYDKSETDNNKENGNFFKEIKGGLRPDTEKDRKMLRTLFWGVSVICILMGIIWCGIHFYGSGIVFMLTGIAINPKIDDGVESRWRKIPSWVPALIWIIGLIIAVALTPARK